MDDQDDNPAFTEASKMMLDCYEFQDLLYTVNYEIKRICYIQYDELDQMQYDTISHSLRMIRDDLTDGGDTEENIKSCLMQWESDIKSDKSKLEKFRSEGHYYKAASKETHLSIFESAYTALLNISINKKGWIK